MKRLDNRHCSSNTYFCVCKLYYQTDFKTLWKYSKNKSKLIYKKVAGCFRYVHKHP
jgi:hypothetical protein